MRAESGLFFSVKFSPAIKAGNQETYLDGTSFQKGSPWIGGILFAWFLLSSIVFVMIEYRIHFRYNDLEQKAGVLRSNTEKVTEYDVRPIDPSVVRKFGRQIIIFKENEAYNCNNHIDRDYKDFFNSLVNALRDHDRGIM